jgi:hypothetical protein
MIWGRKYHWVGNFYFCATYRSYSFFAHHALINKLNAQPQLGYALRGGQLSFTICKIEFLESFVFGKYKEVFVFNAIADGVDYTREWSQAEVANDPLRESNLGEYFYREYVAAIGALQRAGWSDRVPHRNPNVLHFVLFKEVQKGKYNVTEQANSYFQKGVLYDKLPDIRAVNPLADCI